MHRTRSAGVRSRRRRRHRREGESGQAIILGVLSLFLLALMVMMSFNLSQAVHEKIRIQQSSDAMAYSMAVSQARAFNYFAYTNRTMAAAYVSMASLHAYMASATSTLAMLKQAEVHYYIFAALEVVEACKCKYCACVQHFFHAAQAVRTGLRHGREARSLRNDLRDIDEHFDRAIAALQFKINLLHGSQQAMYAYTAQQLAGIGPSYKLGDIADTNAPQADGGLLLGAINANNFNCAIDGGLIPCLDLGGERPGEVDKENKRAVMTEVANATRANTGHSGVSNHTWITERVDMFMGIIPLHLHPNFLQNFMDDIPGDSDNFAMLPRGTAKFTDDMSRDALSSADQGTDGSVVGADEHGYVMSMWEHQHIMPPIMAGPYHAEIYSHTDGGRHRYSTLFGFAHTNVGGTDHDEFQGVHAGDGFGSCILRGSCFMKFNSDPSPDRAFGQPAVFSYHRQGLNLNEDGETGPWELNQQAEVRFAHGDMGEGRLRLAAGDGAAISKALTYYHRLGNWQEPPNFFNPYWRAKLHPFTDDEALLVLGAALELEAAAFAGANRFVPDLVKVPLP
jgi:hypothetical protein